VPAVVDPVVAVRRDAQLTEPAEQRGGRSVDLDGAQENVIGIVDVTVARQLALGLAGPGAPGREWSGGNDEASGSCDDRILAGSVQARACACR